MKAKQTHPRAGVVGITHVRTVHDVEEYVLTKNGLRILYVHDDSAPVTGVMVTYLVGSRHEAVGHTGATHLLEHLMFKGSKQFPKKNGVSVLDTLSDKGALVNATTWFDRTNYYEVLPEEHCEFALRLEADRMRHATITQRDFTEEMPAVRSEFAMHENEPQDVLETYLFATAYQAHPYHHSTIGWLSDVENVPLERLIAFYNTYYWPNNAYVTVVGSIERTRALTLIKKYFGVHPRAPHAIPQPYTKEPLQTGTRQFEVKRAGTKNMLGVAFKVPEGLHADMPALLVLGSVLGGGRTSRLHRALVEKKHASEASSAIVPFHDPSLMILYATLNGSTPHEKLHRLVLDECAKVAHDGVTQSELKRTLAQLETELAFTRDGHYALLATLNEAIAAGDWRMFFDLPDAIRKVTVHDVRAVAARYLTEDQMTVGYYRAMDTEVPAAQKKARKTTHPL